MYNDFNYENALEKIKSALYDIYESQEVRIGLENDNNKKNEIVKRYISVKDLASKLIEDIEDLYSNEETDVNEPKITQTYNYETRENQTAKIDDSNVKEDLEREDIHKNLPRFYLDFRNGAKPNFAFVPDSIYIKLKTNGRSLFYDNRFYKQDTIEKKGIIVRKDQFMKLSLSKDRQEGMLREAKQYRIELARKSRQKLQDII